jgi:hypothetical protein
LQATLSILDAGDGASVAAQNRFANRLHPALQEPEILIENPPPLSRTDNGKGIKNGKYWEFRMKAVEEGDGVEIRLV